MGKNSRRHFLKQVAGATGASILGGCRTGGGASDRPAIPPHAFLELPGVHGYAEKSVAAGEMLHFRISSAVPVELSVCRLGTRVDDPASDLVVAVLPSSVPGSQPIHPGSYVHVETGLPAESDIAALTLDCWVRPWRLNGFQGLVTQHDYPGGCGYGLFLDEQGRVLFYLGDGGAFREGAAHAGPKLEKRRWAHVVGTWDGASQALWVDGKPAGRRAWRGPARPGRAPIRLGAYGENGMAAKFLDGDLAMPAIYARALSEEEIARRFESKGLEPARGRDVLAFWPLSEERGDRVTDAGPQGRHGRIINRATWMVGGPGFDGAAVRRYGADYDPARDSGRGHGLRFASDDLYDCRWKVTHEWRVPGDAKPGLYAGRVRFEKDGKPWSYPITFIVRKPKDRSRAPILVLCSSNTWLAYNSTPFGTNTPPFPFWGTDGVANSAPAAPVWSCYRDHRAGQPTYQIGLNVPWPGAAPDVLYSPKAVGYSHLMRAERFLHAWLEESGYDYDMVTDLDLHRDPGLLAGYKTVIINGHSEYWSAEAVAGVDRYLQGGGSAIVLSGNTMFWRVSFDDEVMECRKFQSDIGGRPAATVGELYHSHDAKRGSLMRNCGHPAWEVVGLECVGWAGTGRVKDYGVYHVEEPGHVLFQRPEPWGWRKATRSATPRTVACRVPSATSGTSGSRPCSG